nr:MAG TPA: hypothetical protein [Caudoviricetes sp.]
MFILCCAFCSRFCYFHYLCTHIKGCRGVFSLALILGNV